MALTASAPLLTMAVVTASLSLSDPATIMHSLNRANVFLSIGKKCSVLVSTFISCQCYEEILLLIKVKELYRPTYVSKYIFFVVMRLFSAFKKCDEKMRLCSHAHVPCQSDHE